MYTYVYVHRVPIKGCHQTHGGNFIKSQPIFKILLPMERDGNLKCKQIISHEPVKFPQLSEDKATSKL